MFFYFCSEYLSAIKLNGVYLGVIYPEILPCQIDLSSTTFVEVCPMTPGELPVNFLLDEKFPLNVPPHFSVTDLDGGFLIKFLKSGQKKDLTVLCQERFNDLAVTVFNDNGLKYSIENAYGFFAEDVNFLFDDAKVKRFFLSGRELLLLELSSERHVRIYVFDFNGKITKLLYDDVNFCDVENGLKTRTDYLDMAKHSVLKEYAFNDSLTVINRTVTAEKDYIAHPPTKNLLSYVFMEEFLVGGDYHKYLTDDLQKDADKLIDYFASVLGIMPPPPFRDVNEIGLIYKKSDNLYHVKYAVFESVDNKISNVIIK